MNCSSCGHTNRDAARYCDSCGRSLTARQTEVVGAKTEELAATRKVVTIVFADLIGSTALHERLDAESAGFFMERYYAAMRGAVEAHAGKVTQFLGDGVKAVFGAPRVAEDDAIRAVSAAVEMQRAFRLLAQQQIGAVGKTGLRVAVNTGEVVANDETEIIGDPVNVAARLQEQGRDGDVVIGESTQALVATLVTLTPLGSFTLKGRAEAVRAYRVVSLDAPDSPAAAAFIGRDAELVRIGAVFEAVLEAAAARVAAVLGSPGLGKSRLIAEYADGLGDAATVLNAHCDAAGSATFAPLADALRTFFQLDEGGDDALRSALEAALPDDDAERERIMAGIAALLAGLPASPEETFFVVRRLLGALAATKPVVLIIDDLHLAKPLLLDLIEHLVQWGNGVPLFILVGARPELRDMRASLAASGSVAAEVITLMGLDAGAATKLAASIIGAADLPTAAAAKLLATSEGNPLFIGELVRMMVHAGALRQDGERWTVGAGLASLEMPPTIHALLAARIERLRPEERSVLERAAVVGRTFSRSAVEELLPRESADLDALLEALQHSELIEPDTGWFLGEPALRFHHGLIRDAAYRQLLKGTRAELHRRFADWIEARAPNAVEHDAVLGWHLEQAHQHLRELAPLDARGRLVGERAARHLVAAGRRALARDDLSLAANLLGRALDRLEAADPARADLALDWCEALLEAGEVGTAAAAIDELDRFACDSPRLRAWHTCFVGHLTALTAPQRLQATVDAVAAAAAALASLGDSAGEAKAHAVHAQALSRLGEFGASEAALDRALVAARRAGERRRENAALAGAPLAALWGPSPVARASGRCLEVVRVLRISQEAPGVEAIALSCQGILEGLRGRIDAGRRMIGSSRKIVEELGITRSLLEADVFAGRIELLEGNAIAAERCLRGAYEGLRELGLGVDAAQAAALLGRAMLLQGRATDAEAFSLESEALAGDDLQAAIAWRGIRAEALSRRGEHAAAVELAEAAVAIAAATDALLDHADARRTLAAVLRASGRGADGTIEEQHAIELWQAKGATLFADRADRDARLVAATTIVTRSLPIEAHASHQRRVELNSVGAALAGLDAAFAARDIDALTSMFSDSFEELDLQTGVNRGRHAVVTSLQQQLQAQDPRLGHELLATRGDSLGLARRWRSIGALPSGQLDGGEHQTEHVGIFEVDRHGQLHHVEVLAADCLGDAVVRLYERSADQFPNGPEQVRAFAIARSVAVIIGLIDPDRVAAVLAPDLESADHRNVGFGVLHGADALLRALRALLELSEGLTLRVDDVIALRTDALLVGLTNHGIDRAGGGAFERTGCMLLVFGTDGRITHLEQFDVDHRAALTRLYEIVGEDDTTRLGG